MKLTPQKKAELTAGRILEAWSDGIEGLYALAKRQIVSELLRDKKRLKEEYGFFVEGKL